MIQKPSVPKGTRDFLPSEMTKRNYIFDTVKDVFRLYGFQPIETPAMENISTLLGKYGDEGDRLLFKVLNSGDFMSKVPDDVYNEKDSSKLASQISDKGLHYDLTVPFARFVVQHRSEISFPFKRYQIQPVWRADRPQKGRYREFYQCDVDIIGSNSLLNEMELIQIIDDVFERFKLNTVLKINNRKILAGIVEYIGEKERLTDITTAIDKLEKIGLDNVNSELAGKGVSAEAVAKLQPILEMKGNHEEKITRLENILANSETGREGLKEIRVLFDYLKIFNLTTEVEFDLTLTRGLNYYTGTIFEVKAKDFAIGSICGGGRYDDLTGIFGLPDVSGVGVSFGAERIFDVLVQLNLFPDELLKTTKVLFLNFGLKEEMYCLPVVSQLRKHNVNTEIFMDSAKIKKQMAYANDKKIPFVVMAGENEMNEGKFTLKNMQDGSQQLLTAEELINVLSN